MINSQRRNVNEALRRSGKATTPGLKMDMGKWAAFACDVYKGFQKTEQTVAVVISLEDVYNRVQFKLLMNLLIVFSIESAYHCPGGLQEHSWKEQWLYSLETGALPLIRSQWAYHKDHRSCRSSSMSTPRPGRSEPKWTQQDSHTDR